MPLSVPLVSSLACALVLALGAPSPIQGPTQAAADAQLAGAEARYRAAIATTPNMSAYHESLALVLERQHRLDDALRSHREAVRLDSSSARNRAGLGLLLLKLGRTTEAIPELRAAAAIDRNSVDIRRQLAVALLREGRSEAALVVLREARRLDSTDRVIDSLITETRSASATAGYHDYSSFADEQGRSRQVLHALEIVFAVLLGICGLALVPPLVGGLLLALVQLPRQWIRGSAS
jgi:tetratricopeptide (TPR) repeat protein